MKRKRVIQAIQDPDLSEARSSLSRRIVEPPVGKRTLSERLTRKGILYAPPIP